MNSEIIYTSFRAENSKPWSVAINLWRYLLKYFLKKRQYSQSDIEWEERNNKIFNHLLVSGNQIEGACIGFSGDIMWVRKEDPLMISGEVKERMLRADYWIGNLETTIVPEKKVKRFWPDYIRFSSSSKLLMALNSNDKNLLGMVSIANNHIMDNRDPGLNTTINILEKEGIPYSGINDGYCIKEYKNIRIGFYAMTYGVNIPDNRSAYSVNHFDYSEKSLEKVREVFRRMDGENVDLKIVSLHWGYEFEFIPDPKQRSYARELVKAGTDVILGHHPHVIQPMEILFLGGYEKSLNFSVDPESCLEAKTPRKAMIMYSLGNFVTDMFTYEVRKGAGVVLKIFKKGKGTDWQIEDLFFLENIRSGLARPHRTVLSEDIFPRSNEHISH